MMFTLFRAALSTEVPSERRKHVGKTLTDLSHFVSNAVNNGIFDDLSKGTSKLSDFEFEFHKLREREKKFRDRPLGEVFVLTPCLAGSVHDLQD